MDQAFPQSQIRSELERLSKRYHVTGAWIAIVFDPVFGITDYINGYEGWEYIMIIRFAIAAITFATLLAWLKLRFPSYILVFVPFLLISLQNAYTYDFITMEHFLGHNINYIALWIGAGMFVLWDWRYSVFMVVISLLSSWYFFHHNELMGEALDDRYQVALVEGGLLLVVVAAFMIGLIRTRYQSTIRTIKAQLALESSNRALQEQKEITEKKNKSIMSSIRYAERIQNATLPPISQLKSHFQDLFVLFKPRDVVSGDFYWHWHGEGKTIVAAIDCTGHGVPGAFMSMKGDALLDQIVKEQGITEPNLILGALHEGIRTSLKQTETNNHDGMDAALILFDHQKNKLTFSGAKNPLLFVQDHTIHTIKGDRVSIGGHQREERRRFTPHDLFIDRPTSIYLFSDGYQDQFGGEKRRRFGIKNMRDILLEIHQSPFDLQQEKLDKTIVDWMEKSGEKQIDDILVIGLKLS